MIADASGPPDAGALAPAPLLLEADGEAAVPQPVTRIRVSPMAPRVERGRCIRPPPGVPSRWVDWSAGGRGLRWPRPVRGCAGCGLLRARDRCAASSAGPG